MAPSLHSCRDGSDGVTPAGPRGGQAGTQPCRRRGRAAQAAPGPPLQDLPELHLLKAPDFEGYQKATEELCMSAKASGTRQSVEIQELGSRHRGSGTMDKHK